MNTQATPPSTKALPLTGPVTAWPSAALASALSITVHDVAFPADCPGGEGADVAGEAGNGGEMYAWVDPGDADSMPEHVCGLIDEAMGSCCPGEPPARAQGPLSDAVHRQPGL